MGAIAVVLALIGLTVLLWPELRAGFIDPNVRELSEDWNSYMERRISVVGTVSSLVEYPFAIGTDVENMQMVLSDDSASVVLIYDRNSASYQPGIGDRVEVTGAITEYGPGRRKFICTEVKRAD